MGHFQEDHPKLVLSKLKTMVTKVIIVFITNHLGNQKPNTNAKPVEDSGCPGDYIVDLSQKLTYRLVII